MAGADGACMLRMVATRIAPLLAMGLVACVEPEADLGTSGPGGKADGDYDDFLAELYCEPDTGVCIVEGDIALAGEDAVRAYFDRTRTAPGALSVFREDEVDKIWNKLDRFALTYCVSSTEFTGEEYAVMVAEMAAATAEWERNAHVDFKHVPAEDGRCVIGSKAVRFTVVKAPSDAPYIARAFFPYYEETDAAIRMHFPALIDLQTRSPEVNLRGVLRHELGHTLGFRHEHIRPENTSWCDEAETFRPLTEYDRRSTMHYPHCDGEGDWSLQLTELDAIGAAFFYPNFDAYRGERCPGAEVNADGTVNAACLPVVHEMLEIVNTASFDVLDNYMHLDRRAADAIVAMRGTKPFTTLKALYDVLYIGPVSVRRIYDYLYVNGRCAQETDIDGLLDVRCRPVVHRLLALANTATQQQLDIDIGLDSRAAANLVTTRTTNAFTSLVEVWDVSYVKLTALRKLYQYAY